ncbi:MAG: hypothetical protein ACI9T8_000477 [Candidatus Saccharimonadales bacterium]|jgi:hypothetical protein
MQSTNHKVIAAAVVAILAIIGVVVFTGNSDDTVVTDENSNITTLQKAVPLNLNLTNLQPLTEGVYEGWVVRGDDKFSFGTFNTDSSDNIIGELNLGATEPQNGDKVVITIEPSVDDDDGPSGVVILAGDIVDGSASLAFPIDVSEFSGQYILATPTNDPAEFETSGIWFLDPSNMTASLNLPDAPDGWVYEGWVVHQGNPISSGKFKTAAGFDMFDGYSGQKDGPPFPGEDFVANLPFGIDMPIELADGMSKIVISIEPDIAGVDPTGDGPAQVKPLSTDVPESAKDHFLYDLGASSESVPSGSASL